MLSLRDWLKEDVRISVEAVKMAPGIVSEQAEVARESGKHVKRGDGSRTFFSTDSDQHRETLGPKPPCMYCGGNHGVWSCSRFQSAGMLQRTSGHLFAVLLAIMKGEIVPELVLVTSMAVGEIITTFL